jgi:3-hydroxy-9,10-secoandrosta-1,3,5(10)-triene-9,17-dione monooxygenase
MGEQPSGDIYREVETKEMTQVAKSEHASPAALAAELRAQLVRNAAQTERDRRLQEENVQALEASNLFSVMTPRRWSGYGAPLPSAIRTFIELGKGCGSTGWVAMILNGGSWWASRLPDAGQEEIFSNSHPRVCGTGTQESRAKRVKSGVRVSGKFPFASGCLHASWAGLSIDLEDDDHRVVDTIIAFAPMSELRIEDTWYVAGMCGTGSNTLVADDLFIPDHRLLKASKQLSGEHQSVKHKGEPSDSYPFAAVNTLVCAAPIVGIAQAMLAEIISAAPRRGITFTTYTRQAESPVIQHQLAEAAINIETAELLVMSCAEQLESRAAIGELMEYQNRARIRGKAGYTAKLLREAVDILASIGGASGFAEVSPLQRMWRDVNVATRHGLLATDPVLEIYGRALLGIEGNISPLI